MNCRNSDLPDTAMGPSCGCGRSLSDISGPGPVVRPMANFCFDDNDPRFPIGWDMFRCRCGGPYIR